MGDTALYSYSFLGPRFLNYCGLDEGRSTLMLTTTTKKKAVQSVYKTGEPGEVGLILRVMCLQAKGTLHSRGSRLQSRYLLHISGLRKGVERGCRKQESGLPAVATGKRCAEKDHKPCRPKKSQPVQYSKADDPSRRQGHLWDIST